MSDKNNQNFPYEWENLSAEENKEIMHYLKGSITKFFRVGPTKYLLPNSYVKEAGNIYNMPIRPDDTFVVTFPRSGTTWTQELVWLVKNNLDFETAKSITLNQRFSFLEDFMLPPPPMPYKLPSSLEESIMTSLVPLTIEQIKQTPSPRFIKSHLPLSLLPATLVDTAKPFSSDLSPHLVVQACFFSFQLVYIARDPRDVAVSQFYHLQLIKAMSDDIEFKDYWNYFIEDKVLWGPHFGHMLEAWAIRNHPNILFLHYEDLLKHLPSGIRRVAEFFDKKLTEEDIMKLSEHLKFDNFKKNKAVNREVFQNTGIFARGNGFIRQGKSGGWRNHFDEEMTAQAEEWIDRMLRDTDFKFPHI